MKKSIEYSYDLNDKRHIEFRLITPNDSIDEITDLLNKSYKTLSDMGLQYVAATQDNTITLSRISKAHKCFVGVCNGKIIATIALYNHRPSSDCNWYDKDYVAKFGQFAVLPEFQKYGIGNKMMDIVEYEVRGIESAKELALDTAETAYQLIDFYKKRGYRYIETTQWKMTNYRSVILSKLIY